MAYAGSASLQKGFGFVLFLWLARALPVEQYAHFGLLFALQTGLTTFASAGVIELTIAALKEHASPGSRMAIYARANLLNYALAVAGTVFALLVYRYLVQAPGSAAEFLSIVACGALTAFFANQAAFSRLDERHAMSLTIGFAVPVAGLVAAALAFWAWRSVPAFFMGMAGGLAMAYGVFRFRAAGHGPAGDGWRPVIPLLVAALPYIVITVLVWLGGYGNTYFVDAFFSSADVARFTFAYTLSSILQLVATSLNQVWSPRFFNSVGMQTVDQLEASNVRFFRLQGLALGVCGGFIVIVLPLVLNAAGGNLLQYRFVGADLTWLFAGYAVAIPWWHAQNYFLVYGQGRRLMFIVLYSTLAGVAVWLVLMKLMGVVGIYIGFMVQMLIRSACIWFVANRAWSLRLTWHGPVLALAVLAGARVVSDLLAVGRAP
jgi:O-antigen/teichoic acid export membrane protein